MIKGTSHKKYQIYFLRVVIITAFLFSLKFIAWFFNSEIIDNKILFGLISIGIVYRFLRLYHQWVHLFFLKKSFKFQKNKPNLMVDVFTTFCPGEPYEMVEETLLAIKKISYPHNTFLCSEGDDERLKNFCEQNKIHFVPRYTRDNAKAGNINNGLKHSKSDICVVLDPDHIPSEDFIDTVLPYFEDEKVGFVQVPQVYYNQKDSKIARGAAEQTYEFYGPLMTSMDEFGTAQAIGANCTFRRKALDSIGGHAPGLTEDMHTSMLLHAKGWKSRFVPKVVSKGLVPVSKSTYFDQQLKWSRGSFDLLFKVLPKVFGKLTWAQKLHYLSIPVYFLFGLFAFFDLLIPVVSLFIGDYPLKCRMDELAFMLLPLIAFSIFIKQYAQKWFYFDHEKGFHYYAEVLRLNVWWINCLGFLYTLLGKKVPYIPTKKDDQLTNEFKLALPNIIFLIIILCSIIYGYNNDYSESSLLMIGYLAYLSINLLVGFFLGLQLVSEKILKFLDFHRMGNFRLTLLNITTYSFLIFSIMATLFFNFNYKNTINPLGDVMPPENKRNSIQLFYNTSADNIQKVGLDSFKENKIDDEKFLYFDLKEKAVDTLGVKQALDSIFGTVQNSTKPYFIDLINVDLVANYERINELFKYQYAYAVSKGQNPVFVFGISRVDSIDSYFPDNKYVDVINYYTKGSNLLDDLNFNYHKMMLKNRPIIVSNVVDANVSFNDLKFQFNNLSGLFFKDRSKVRIQAKDNQIKLFEESISSVDRKLIKENIKGVYYNTKQDWKDDFQQLTTKAIERDFTKITEMGANTILRYGPTFGDRNILESAKKFNLDVFYGFNIFPHFDYLDEDFVADKSQEIINQSKQELYRNVECFVLGTDVLSELGNYYAEPTLTYQRVAYLKFVNGLAERMEKPISIHLSVDEKIYYYQKLLKTYAPSLDYIGLNIDYTDDFESLKNIELPFYIAGIGVDGANEFDKNNIQLYEDVDGKLKENIALEMSDSIKSNQILEKIDSSNKYTDICFIDCWTDKMDETFTWYGLTDYKGRTKPSFYRIQQEWSKKAIVNYPSVEIIPNNSYYEEDSTYTFEAKISNQSKFDKIEWMLCKNNIIPISDAIISKNRNLVNIKIPNDKDNISTYRLILFVSDGQNVTTASYFIPLRWYYK